MEPLERAWAIVRRMRNAGQQVTSAGATTQYVVGPAGESDQELLYTSQRLYRQVGLRRAYYSAFSPIDDTPLQDEHATAPLREHRLYQADFLLRQYGFDAKELPFDQAGNLSLERNPKEAWAAAHPEFFPLEINRASQSALLRVPGIGPRGAAAIMQARRSAGLRTLDDLRKLGVRADHVAPYVLISGRTPEHQLRLFT